ncbi:unnamed protein product [Mortierella alpina]
MEETQAFRLIGTTEVVKIPIQHVNGQSVVDWDDIQHVFPGLQYVRNGDVSVNLLKDSNRKTIIPLCIKYFPDVELDVVLSTTVKRASTRYSVPTPVMVLSVLPADTSIDHFTGLYGPGSMKQSENSTTSRPDIVPELAISPDPSLDLSPTEPLSHSTTNKNTTIYLQRRLKALNYKVEDAAKSGQPMDHAAITALIRSRLVPTSTASAVPATIDESHFAADMMQTINGLVQKVDGLTITSEHVKSMVVEVLKNQELILKRLALIRQKAEAILVQNFELHEFTIPRLFIALPETSTSWDPATMLRTKFRLHFICECGEHTEPAQDTAAPTSRISHELHLAKHEGYVVRKPTELFKKYGPFLMVMLELISKERGIDYSLKYLEKTCILMEKSDGIDLRNDAEAVREDLTNYLAGVEGLKGADLRQLGSYLEADSSDNLLANMYRMTTKEGHVKWVCLDHYRVSYQEKQTQKLREVVMLHQGEFDEQLGRITLDLRSSSAATEFFDALRKAKGVLKLIVSLGEECTRSDLHGLKNALRKSRMFFELAPGRIGGKELGLLADMLKTNSTLATLNLDSNTVGDDGAKVLAEALKTNSTLTTLNLPYNSIGDDGAKALAEALETNKTLTILNLESNAIAYDGINALAEMLKTNKTLNALDLHWNSVGSNGAQALSEALMKNKTLTTLNLNNTSIGWEGFSALSEALMTNVGLTTMKLGRNEGEIYGAGVLSRALETNRILNTLDMTGNSIRDSGAQALSSALKTNSTLTALNLMGNSIGDDGARTLAEVLHTNSTLMTLDLMANLIGDNGAVALSEALKINSTLTSLNLYWNLIGSDGAQALSSALKTNSTLKTLDLNENSIGSNGAQALAEALKTNSTLTTLDLGQAVLTQTYNLHEYRIPCLLVVLPQDPLGWRTTYPFSNKYRVHFLCDCGEYTKSINNNTKISHDVHLTEHEGYEIAGPSVFFSQLYEYYAMNLKMLKYGISVAGLAIPAVSHLINADALDHAAESLQHLKDCIEPCTDQVISEIEKASVDEGVGKFADQIEYMKSMKGADLRKLESFLEKNDGIKAPGNLCKTLTKDGQVRWVCIDHCNVPDLQSSRKSIS